MQSEKPEEVSRKRERSPSPSRSSSSLFGSTAETQEVESPKPKKDKSAREVSESKDARAKRLNSKRPSSPDQSSRGFFPKKLLALIPREDKNIVSTRAIEQEGGNKYEYIISESEPVKFADDKYLIRTIKINSDKPYRLEMMLDESVRTGQVGIIRAELCECNDIRERVQGLPPIAVAVRNDSTDPRLLKIKAQKKEKSYENFGLFFSLLVREKYLSDTTAETALALLLQEPKVSPKPLPASSSHS